MSAIRVLHVVDSIHPNKGGPIECIFQIGRGLIAGGDAEVEILCFDRPGSPWLKKSPLITHSIGPSYLRYAYCPRLIPWLKTNGQQYDILVINGLWQYYGLGVSLYAQATGIPYYLYAHGHLDPWTKTKYPAKYAKKWLYWQLIERRITEHAKAIVFTSEEEAVLARNYFSNFRARSLVVGNGISSPPPDANSQAEALLSAFPHLRGKRIILFMARLHEKKGCDLLLHAFAEYCVADPDLHLLVAGPDEQGHLTHLVSIVNKHHLEKRVTFTGRLDGELKWGAVRACELFILPSHQENFGIAVVESLACAKPVIISDRVNIWREIMAAGAGIVCTPDIASIVQALRAWEALPLSGRREMQLSAQRLYSDQFTVHAPISRLRAEYLRMMGYGE